MSITIKETQNPAIIKFELQDFITKNQNFEFKNIDETKNSPLAQKLFYLPFVKTVYISGNFIAIERFQSLNSPGKILSLSWWEDEASVANWQQNERHLAAQREGKASIFSYYRIRVARVFRDYSSDRGAQPDV